MNTKYLTAILVICLMSGAAFSAAATKPNLSVPKVKIDKSSVNKDGKVIILYTVKNTGKAVSRASVARISVNSGTEKVISTPSIPSLDPGASYSGQATYSVSSKKDYLFKVTADYKDRIRESNELNNENKVSFSFGKAF